jgi:hypothetical protein
MSHDVKYICYIELDISSCRKCTGGRHLGP